MFSSGFGLIALSLLSLAGAAPTTIVKRGSGKVGHTDRGMPDSWLTTTQAGISWPVQELSAKPVELFFGSNSVRFLSFQYRKPADG